jgi:DNA-binding PadR family transcriptional regulator
MIPMYLLGLLQRMGPMHGYRIKQQIAEQLADFTQIKLPTIYYHLEKMTQKGLVEIVDVDEDKQRPEKTVYAITKSGIHAFRDMLGSLFDFPYRPTFPLDGAFFFAESIGETAIIAHLETYAASLKGSIDIIERHGSETLGYVPEEFRPMAAIIFNHHLKHYLAEYEWTQEALQSLK